MLGKVIENREEKIWKTWIGEHVKLSKHAANNELNNRADSEEKDTSIFYLTQPLFTILLLSTILPLYNSSLSV